jgi:two-component system LytT family response regulator
MTTIIVDDEPIARKVLRDELELIPSVEVIGEAGNGLEALRQIESLLPDLVFLDLQMPVMDGFQVVRELRGGHTPAIVIVTAYEQHAIQAFEEGAIDYLLKPVSEARLKHSVERARALLAKPKALAQRIERLAGIAASPAMNRKIIGRSGGEYFLLDAGEVLAFQADREIVWIVTAKHRYLATQSLRAIQERIQHLPFQRVHRNAIVNINHVRKLSVLSSQRWMLTLSNGSELVVSKRQAHSVHQILRW